MLGLADCHVLGNIISLKPVRAVNVVCGMHGIYHILQFMSNVIHYIYRQFV